MYSYVKLYCGGLKAGSVSGLFLVHVAKIWGRKPESLRYKTHHLIILSMALSNLSLLFFFFFFIKGALGGLLTGIILSFWVAIGALIYPAPTSKTWPLPLSTDQCVPSNVTESVPPLLSSRYADLQDSIRSQREGHQVREKCILLC